MHYGNSLDNGRTNLITHYHIDFFVFSRCRLRQLLLDIYFLVGFYIIIAHAVINIIVILALWLGRIGVMAKEVERMKNSTGNYLAQRESSPVFGSFFSTNGKRFDTTIKLAFIVGSLWVTVIRGSTIFRSYVRCFDFRLILKENRVISLTTHFD